jgi:hypothetical protein
MRPDAFHDSSIDKCAPARTLSGQATLPGLGPGPPRGGTSPYGQGRKWLPVVDFTAGRSCRERSGRRAGYLPTCKGSVDCCPPGHALVRNSRRASFACHPHVYEGGTRPREAARRVACLPHIGTPASQPDARLPGLREDTPPRAFGSDQGEPAFRVRSVGYPGQTSFPGGRPGDRGFRYRR